MFRNIDAELARKNISRTKLGELLQCSQPTLRRWINKGEIPATKLPVLCKSLDSSADYLLEDTA